MRLPSRLGVLVAALVVLLPALALLQYLWVGELRDAARDRMQRNLHNAAQQFRESFDGEVARAFLALQLDTATVRDEAWSRYADRFAAWASTTAYPRLIANVYLVDAAAGDLRLRRWDGEARTFAPAPWDGELAGIRPRFASELAAFAGGDRRRWERRLLDGHDSLLAAPLLNLHVGPPPRALAGPLVTLFGFTVLELNRPLVRDEVLPALVRRHFSQAGDDAYRVAVIDASASNSVIYRSSPDAPTDPARADVDVSFFGAHHDPVMFLARGAAREMRERVDRRQVMVSVVRERGDERVTMTRVLGGAQGRWRLLAQHERGSLDAAVAGARQRNLAVSFGILLLMGVTIGMLAVSSRRAQRLARQQMEFVAGVSHELRTPVAVIHSAAENLSQGVIGDAERVRRYGEAIETEARRLGEMIERVLHFAGIESGRVARTPVALAPVIDEAIDAALPREGDPFAVERQIAADLPLVLGDATALRSAIQNLVANAVKYGGADRWIRVRAETARGGGPSIEMRKDDAWHVRSRERRPRTLEVRVTVEDHGGGIASSDLVHIFEPFYRGSGAAARQIHGSGLGLALVRAIVHAHGGRISVVTREGTGTAFTLHLPVAPAPAQPVRVPSPNEAAAG